MASIICIEFRDVSHTTNPLCVWCKWCTHSFYCFLCHSFSILFINHKALDCKMIHSYLHIHFFSVLPRNSPCFAFITSRFSMNGPSIWGLDIPSLSFVNFNGVQLYSERVIIQRFWCIIIYYYVLHSFQFI